MHIYYDKLTCNIAGSSDISTLCTTTLNNSLTNEGGSGGSHPLIIITRISNVDCTDKSCDNNVIYIDFVCLTETIPNGIWVSDADNISIAVGNSLLCNKGWHPGLLAKQRNTSSKQELTAGSVFVETRSCDLSHASHMTTYQESIWETEISLKELCALND